MINLLSLIKKKSAPPIFFAVDLGSSLIKVSKFSFLPDNRILLEDISTVATPLSAISLGIVRDSSAIVETLSKILPSGANVIFGLSGESVFGFATTVKVKRQNPDEKIGKGELTEVIKKIQELAFIEAGQIQSSRVGRGEKELDMVNSGVIITKVDGVLIEDALSQVGKYLEIGVFTSFAERDVLASILDLCKKLKVNFIAASSQMYSLSKFLKFDKNSLNAILVDFGGDKTDVGICYGGAVVATKTLDFGGVQLTKEISKILEVEINEAEKKKISYEEGTIGAEQVKEITSKVLNYWLLGIETVLENFDGIKVFPPKVIIFGGGGLTYDLVKILRERKWYENFPFKSVPEIEIASLDNFQNEIEDPNGYLKDLKNAVSVSLGMVGLEIFS